MVSSKACNEVRIDGDVKLDLENAKRGTNSRQKTHMVRIVTGILVWTLICIPSNIVAGIFYFRQNDFGQYDQSIDSNNSMNSHYVEDDLESFNFSTVSTEVSIIEFSNIISCILPIIWYSVSKMEVNDPVIHFPN